MQLVFPMLSLKENELTTRVLAWAESPTLAKSSSSQRFTDLQSTDGGQASKWKLVRCENGTPCFISVYG